MITIIVFGVVEALILYMFIQMVPHYVRGGAKFFIHTTYVILAMLISLVFVLLFGSLFGKQDTTYTRMGDNKYRVHQKIKLFGEDVLDVNGDKDGDIAVKNGNTYFYQEDKNEWI